MDIRKCLTDSPRRCGRNSDPDPLWWKEEQLDGRLTWPKLIDPLTQRPVAPFYRHEARAEREHDES